MSLFPNEMPQVYKERILFNFVKLVEYIDLKSLTHYLLKNKVINQREVNEIYEHETDTKHCKRLLLFLLMRKDIFAFYNLISGLRNIGQEYLANDLDSFEPLEESKRNHPVVFHKGRPDSLPIGKDIVDHEVNVPISTIPTVVHTGREPITVKVRHSDRFYDTPERHKFGCYSTRSRSRGCVLIINNYDYSASEHTYRTGAPCDTKNLKSLFEQMKMKVYCHENVPGEKMKVILKDFAQYSPEKVADICFIIIMCHGHLENNVLHAVGTDDVKVRTSWIENLFDNHSCTLFYKKPKVFIYQMCRGESLDYASFEIATTHTDSSERTTTVVERTQTDSISSASSIKRTFEDILIAHATLKGYQANRDVYLGSWFIQLVCSVFMEHAHDTHIFDLFQEVNNRLGKMVSEKGVIQSSEQTTVGFKPLYLHPGIYEDDEGNIQKL